MSLIFVDCEAPFGVGSDRKRELLGITMLNNEDPHPTFLIQKGDVWKQE